MLRDTTHAETHHNSTDRGLLSSGQRQERVQRNRERMESLGLQHMAQLVKPAKRVAVPAVRAKQSGAKPKAVVPQRSYSLRGRGGTAAAAANQPAGHPGQASITTRYKAFSYYCR